MTKMKRTIRKSVVADIGCIMDLLEMGRQKMRANGNMEQWTNGNPKQALVEEDIRKGNSYVMEEDGVVIATFAFIEGPDVTYNSIYEGEWMAGEMPYHVVHRMASRHGVHGVFKDVLDFCFERCGNIRIDTHRNNRAMLAMLKKLGYSRCGRITLQSGAKREALHKELNFSKK